MRTPPGSLLGRLYDKASSRTCIPQIIQQIPNILLAIHQYHTTPIPFKTDPVSRREHRLQIPEHRKSNFTSRYPQGLTLPIGKFWPRAKGVHSRSEMSEGAERVV